MSKALALKKHPLHLWYKVAIATAAVALLSLTFWFGSDSLYSGRLTGLVPNLSPQLLYPVTVTNVTVTPDTMVYGSTSLRSQMSISFTLPRVVTNFKIQVLDQSNRLVKQIGIPSTNGPGSFTNAFGWDGRGDGTNYTGFAPIGTYKIVFSAAQSTSVSKTVYITSGTPDTFTGDGNPLSARSVTTSHLTYGVRTPAMFVSYSLSRAVNNVTVKVIDSSDRVVRVLEAPTSRAAGSYSVALGWDGTGDGVTYSGNAPVGTYKIAITTDAWTDYQTVYIDSVSGGQNYNGLIIYNASQPSNETVINYDANQKSHVYFSLLRPAYVTAEVYRADSNSIVRRLKNSEYWSTLNTQLNVEWDGRTDENNVQGGYFQIRISARDASTGLTENVNYNVQVIRTSGGTGNFQFTQVTMDPLVFDARVSPVIRFNFTVNQLPASTLTAQIYDNSGSRLVAYLTVLGPYNSNSAYYSYYAEWDGIDRINGAQAYPGSYKLKLAATNANYGTITRDEPFQVVLAGTSGGYNPVGNVYGPYPTCDRNNPYINQNCNNGYIPEPIFPRCNNFEDVAENSSMCPAVKFAVSKGFMKGYPDGTIGLNKTIKRAEYLAVIQKAFGFYLEQYNAAADYNLGFRDLVGNQGEWYMPYIKTFSRLGIMKGYPDGTMKPEKTMTTAELYVSIVNAILNSPGRVARFSIPSRTIYQAFDDVPVNQSTNWYARVAMFARENNLVTGREFNPGKAITRGQVIKLIYDMYQKGMLAM